MVSLSITQGNGGEEMRRDTMTIESEISDIELGLDDRYECYADASDDEVEVRFKESVR